MKRKRCSICTRRKSILDFHKHRKSPDGRQYACKLCQREICRVYSQQNRATVTARAKRWNTTNAERTKALRTRYRLKTKYGLTPMQYDRLVREHAGKCKICKTPAKKLVVDHCHRTATVRGLLCRSCNVGLGHFRDNPKLLKRAIAYLAA